MTLSLSSPYFQFIAIPIAAIILAVFVKIVSRNDKFHISRKEDYAVGMEIAIAAILILGTNSLNTSATLPAGASVVLLLSILGLWIVSTIVRKYGWKNKDDMNWWAGIIFPYLYGLAILFITIVLISSPLTSSENGENKDKHFQQQSE